MGSSELQVATLHSLTTFFSSVTVAPLVLNQIAFSVAELFLDPSSDVASTKRYTLLIKVVRKKEKKKIPGEKPWDSLCTGHMNHSSFYTSIVQRCHLQKRTDLQAINASRLGRVFA